MEMISVSCNHCGAPLDAGANARFVTCKFCNSQLEVKRCDSAHSPRNMAGGQENL